MVFGTPILADDCRDSLSVRTDLLRARIGDAPILEGKMPSWVGRLRRWTQAESLLRRPDLVIEDAEPFAVPARFHGCAESGNGSDIDLGSKARDDVNGQSIGHILQGTPRARRRTSRCRRGRDSHFESWYPSVSATYVGVMKRGICPVYGFTRLCSSVMFRSASRRGGSRMLVRAQEQCRRAEGRMRYGIAIVIGVGIEAQRALGWRRLPVV